MEYKGTILIVDDNLAGRETLRGLLYGRGYNLQFATNGPDALQQAETLTPDLILLDVMMPGMDGFEVCQRLRTQSRVAEVPVIMVTALDDRESRLRGIEAGADDFVSKPFDHAELRKRVQTIIRLNRYRRLLSERTKFEWVVNQADDGYLILNNKSLITYINSQGELYLNLAHDKELPKVPFLELTQNRFNCEPADAWDAWPKQTDPTTARYLVQPASVTTNAFWLKVDTIEMHSGESEEYLVRLRDVTQTVAERRSMWTFHGQVSHKLRTPLNHLFTSLDMITAEDLAGVSADTQTFLSIAKQGAARLKDEVQDIFQYIDASYTNQASANGCNLTEVTTIVSEASTYLNVNTIQLTFENIDNPEHYFTILSRSTLEQILLELLENAKKFHPNNTPTLEVRVAFTDGSVIFKVIDDGLTLSPEQLSKMWTPYYQGEKYFTGQVNGTGLGLSVVTALVWGVGGACSAYNRAGQAGIIVELKVPGQSQPYQTPKA